MVKNSIGDWDTNADNNTDVGGINIAENCPAANINNGMREMMAQTRGFWDRQVATVDTKTGNYTAVVADRSSLIRFTSNATLSLAPAATLGNGWYIDFRSDGATVTIDPSSSEAIDGQSTLIVRNGQSGTIYCTGTSFVTSGLREYYEVNHTASLSYEITGTTLRCWGLDATNAGGSVAINYPKTFANNPSIVATPATGGTVFSASIASEGTGGATISTNAGGVVGVRWSASGEWDGIS